MVIYSLLKVNVIGKILAADLFSKAVMTEINFLII